MTDSINVYIPLDTNVNAEGYQIPTIENQITQLVSIFQDTPDNDNNNEVEPEEEDDDDGYGYSQPSVYEKKLDKFYHEKWLDVMSFSHNTSNSGDEPYLGEISLTAYTSERSPSFNYITLRGEDLPHVIMRSVNYKDGQSHLNVKEYELHHVKISNVSISGGSGGKPVESLSIQPKVILIKQTKIDIATAQFTTYQVSRWDMVKGKGAKTLYKPTKVGDPNSLLLVDFDDENSKSLANDFGYGGTVEPKSPVDVESCEDIYKVLIKKDPQIFKAFSILKPTLQTIKKSIAETLNIPLDTIKDIYNGNGLLVDSEKILKISRSFLVETTDGKFIGY